MALHFWHLYSYNGIKLLLLVVPEASQPAVASDLSRLLPTRFVVPLNIV